MATITLKGKPKPAAKTRNAEGEKRAPVRGKGVSKPRPTLAKAQADRAEREEQFQKAQQKRERPAPVREERPARPKTGSAFKPERLQPPRGDAPQRAPRTRPDERPFADRPPRVDQRRVSNRGPGFEAPQRPQQRLNPARQVDAEAGERLSKRMSELKLASRREADEWIAAGWVRVNGKVAVLGQRVIGDVQIDIDPAARQAQSQLVTVLLHKPIGYVSGQAEDGYEPAVVLFQPENRWKDDPSGIKPHPNHHRHLAPAGRLDIDSTGLLVLTQDGRIAKALIGDDSDIEKEYLVRVEFIGHEVPEGTLPNAALAPEQLALLNYGLELDGEALKPAKVSWQNEQQLRFVLREGKKRQIRRMCELVGLKVVGLKRVRIGRIPLGHLPVGQWRYLAPWERF
ncbi:pseudouridine synthase [Roseateles saccharophilus]|uniref:Dual-specificity RNA pseudouridine synthase RluF n=1 Tax=Roseateles saccharophilus TaxID=304 RepID=A0A4R3UIA9_ROSSA|nr:pseudouridine synthase [Roseateles saccharophilus]TCU89761.1 23S rRNA pseudouridine2604 synthase [Roseateles saccharophilus]